MKDGGDAVELERNGRHAGRGGLRDVVGDGKGRSAVVVRALRLNMCASMK